MNRSHSVSLFVALIDTSQAISIVDEHKFYTCHCKVHTTEKEELFFASPRCKTKKSECCAVLTIVRSQWYQFHIFLRLSIGKREREREREVSWYKQTNNT